MKRSESEWVELFEAQASSGQTMTAFCRDRDLCPKYFSVRKRQLGWGQPKGFVQVTQASSDSSHVRLRVLECQVPLPEVGRVLNQLLG